VPVVPSSPLAIAAAVVVAVDPARGNETHRSRSGRSDGPWRRSEHDGDCRFGRGVTSIRDDVKEPPRAQGLVSNSLVVVPIVSRCAQHAAVVCAIDPDVRAAH
jgi:hypothetical protein